MTQVTLEQQGSTYTWVFFFWITQYLTVNGFPLPYDFLANVFFRCIPVVGMRYRIPKTYRTHVD